MPIVAPALALAPLAPLAAGALWQIAKEAYNDPRRAIQKATQGLELASGLALSKTIPWYGAVLATKAATQFLGLQPQYPSKQKAYRRSYETAYARSFRNAPRRLQRSSWRRQKIWTQRKIWRPRTKKNRYRKTKRTWKT